MYKCCRLCARKPMGEDSPHWKGGRAIDKDGYIRVYVDPADFFAAMQHTRLYLMEHRLVVARHLGRCLAPFEVVHHINGDKTDNRIENLELTTKTDHMRSHGAEVKALRRQVKELRQRIKELEKGLEGMK